MKPKTKSIELALAAGWIGGDVERSVNAGKFRRAFDWCGFADALFFRADNPVVLAVQATNTGNVSNHLAKFDANAHLYDFLAVGHLFVIVGFEPSKRLNLPKRAELAGIVDDVVVFRRVAYVDDVLAGWRDLR